MRKSTLGMISAVALCSTTVAMGEMATIKFSNLKQGQMVTSPVEVCMKATGVIIESVQNGVNAGRGHMHLLIDYPLPTDLNQPLPFNVPQQIIHLGDGSNCRTLNLNPGWHSLRAMVADGKHTPGEPPVTSVIDIKVK